MRNYKYIAPNGDAWRNLAIDENFLNTLERGGLCLLLYVNDNAVIIGKNQNPWAECNLERMEEDGVQLVRRCTGGGAVFHDRGNLNFSFIAHEDRYDEGRQTGLILRALKRFGIDAAASGRNDLTACDRKFSGAAFCKRGENRQHHGTLLVNADLARLADYLTVAPQKLTAKGVKSVRGRVCNLVEICPEITVAALSEAIFEEFAREYGESEVFSPGTAAQSGIDKLYERNRSWVWQLGKAPEFDYTYENRYGFGMARLCLNVRGGLIREVKLFTDALDIDIPARTEAALLGKHFSLRLIDEKLKAISR